MYSISVTLYVFFLSGALIFPEKSRHRPVHCIYSQVYIADLKAYSGAIWIFQHSTEDFANISFPVSKELLFTLKLLCA
jgi:hypothetical protein